MGISPDTGIQTNFIDYDAERHDKMKRIDEAIDKINREYGSETIVLGYSNTPSLGVKGRRECLKTVLNTTSAVPATLPVGATFPKPHSMNTRIVV